MQKQPKICIIIPCYNPLPDWGKAFAFKYFEVSEMMRQIGLSAEITIINDGYPNGQKPSVIDEMPAFIPGCKMIDYEQNRGKGYALRIGVAASTADYYLVTDADWPYTTESMVAIAKTLVEKGGIAAGNRDMAYYKNVPAFRQLLSKGLRVMLRYLLRLQVTDSQCGLKGFDNAGRTIFLRTRIDRFLFDLEFLLLARKRVPVTPVTVVLRKGVTFSKVGLKIIATEGWNFLKLFVRQLWM